MTQPHPLTLKPGDVILALDVGDRRIGLAVANAVARLPRALATMERGPDTLKGLHALVAAERVSVVVVGLPRSLDGRSTAQTAATEAFVSELKPALGLTVYWQDEALTSRQAEDGTKTRGPTPYGTSRRQSYTKADIDALSAVYIFEDFLRDGPGGTL